MAVNGDTSQRATTTTTSIQELSQPPSTSSHPTGSKTNKDNGGGAYVLPSLAGEIIYIPCSVSAMRLLVTGKETDNAFAVVGTGGTASAPIGFHFHRETHDVFLCLKGNVNVWAGDQARTMGAGDFASVPPNTIHQYQILGPYAEFLGLIVPGGWEEFFRAIGDPYTSGPLFPLTDTRNPFEVLLPRLKAAAQEFDMVPVPTHPKFDPQPWHSSSKKGGDRSLPEGLEPYFLQNGTGPAYLAGPVVVRPLVTTRQSAGKFAIGVLEGSSWHSHGRNPLFSAKTSDKTSNGSTSTTTTLTFTASHHCIQVADGKLEVTVGAGGATTQLSAMETVFIPAKTPFSFRFASRVARAYVFSNGGGLVELLCRVGKAYEGPVIPEKGEEEDGREGGEMEEALRGLGEELGFRMS